MLLTAEAYGHRVGLRVPSADVDAVRRLLPHWWTDADVEPERVWEAASAVEADSAICELERWVAEWAANRIFVHAAVVAIDGRALLLPGRSRTGKSTLTATLLREGAAYGSDEWAVLSPDGRVHPYPRPVHMRTGPEGAFNRIPVTELGAATISGPLPVAAVAQLHYQPGSEYRVEPLSAGMTVLSLFDHTLCAQSRPPEVLDTLMAATEGVRAVAGSRGEALSAVPALQALVR